MNLKSCLGESNDKSLPTREKRRIVFHHHYRSNGYYFRRDFHKLYRSDPRTEMTSDICTALLHDERYGALEEFLGKKVNVCVVFHFLEQQQQQQQQQSIGCSLGMVVSVFHFLDNNNNNNNNLLVVH